MTFNLSFLYACNMRAKNLLFLSHTMSTFKYAKGGMGEITNAAKLKRLLDSDHYQTTEIVDIYSLFGGLTGIYHSLANLNYSLAHAGEAVIEETNLSGSFSVINQIASYKADICFLLSLNWSVAAISSLGIQKKMPMVTKLYVHHEDEKIPVSLYEPSTLLLTESLLASKKAIDAGIPPWKIIFFPNHYPKEIESLKSNKNHLHKIAKKKIRFNEKTTVVGIVSRLEYGKNIEYAIDALEKLVAEGEDLILFLKGSFDPEPIYPFYQTHLQKKLDSLMSEDWFIWDQKFTPFPEVLEEYASIDILVHLSGSEAGSNIIAEFLGLGKPVIILEASTNPSLYREGAIFVQSEGFVKEAFLPFALPEKKDLYNKLKSLIKSKAEQDKWGKKAQSVAKARFSPERTLRRIPLILKAAMAFFYNTPEKDTLKQQITRLYEEDRHSDWP